MPLACVLTAGAITAAIVVVHHGSNETRATAEALCVQVAQHENPDSDITILATESLGNSQYAVSGTMTERGKGPVEFDCMAYSDGHDGWGAMTGDQATPK